MQIVYELATRQVKQEQFSVVSSQFLGSNGGLIPEDCRLPYPFTLIFENEITARPAVGRPMERAGRKVV